MAIKSNNSPLYVSTINTDESLINAVESLAQSEFFQSSDRIAVWYKGYKKDDTADSGYKTEVGIRAIRPKYSK